jgi:hypothetical protein
MKVFKTITLSIALISLFSCSERLSPKRSDAEQQEVKQQVMKLFDDEYHQPFELKSFNYKYDTKYKYAFLYAKGETSGMYSFKVAAINNPAIISSFHIFDGKEESIKELIDSFKKNRLKTIYCGSFSDYWYKHRKDKGNKALEEMVKYCNYRGQEEEYNVYAR